MGSTAFLIYTLLSITIVTDGALLLFVYGGKQRGLLRSLFLMHLAGVLGWAISILLLLRLESAIATQAAFATALVLAVGKHYFVLAFPENRLPKGVLTYLPLIPALGALVLSAIPGALFGAINVIEGYYIQIENGPFALYYLLTVSFFLLYPIVSLFRKYRDPRYVGVVKEQLRYLLIGISIFFLIGLATNSILPVFFDIYFFNGIGPSFALVLAGFIVYTISRHRFLELRIILQRGLVYSVTLSGIVAFYLSTLHVLGFFIQEAAGTALVLGGGITTIAGIFTVPHIDRYLRRATDKYFFKDTYDYADALLTLSEVTNVHIILEDLIRKAEESLVHIFKTEYAHIAVADEDGAPPSIFEAEDRTTLSIPITLGRSVLGTLELGEKRSGDLYTAVDKALLKTFSSQIAVALEKARLYKMVEDYSRELEERVLTRTSEVIELQEERSRIFLDISHKLQSPLTVMKSELESLKRRESNQKEIAVLNKTIDELSLFLYDLLHLARLDDTPEYAKKERLNLSELLLELSEYYDVLALDRGITLTSIIEPNIAIVGDREKISELVTNLMSNAIKYMGTREAVREVRIMLKQEDDEILLEVTDTGIGIGEKDLPRIFDRFYRSGSALASQIPGTGLGLAIAHKIVEIHGGTIAVESTIGVGTTIQVRFSAESNAETNFFLPALPLSSSV